MEHTGYWMWTSGRKPNSLSHIQSTVAAEAYSSRVSWEEQAFAEDSAGILGACVWPPRSYACSFCRREFRSAQALGGHMNVHRRDRARLKQSPNANLDPSTQLGIEYPAQSSTFVCNPNPNPNPSTNTIAPSLFSSRVLAQDTEEENGSEQNMVSPSYSSLPLVQEQPRNFSAFPPLSLSFGDLFLLDSKLHREKWKKGDAVCRDETDYVKTDSAVRSQGMVRLRSQTPDDEEPNGEKRQRKDAPLIPLFVKSDMGERQKIDVSFPIFARRTSHDRHHTRSKALGLGPSPMDDIDLELRLGDPPKVK